MPKIDVELLGSADSGSVLMVNQRKLELLSQLFINATVSGAGIDEGLNQLCWSLGKC